MSDTAPESVTSRNLKKTCPFCGQEEYLPNHLPICGGVDR